MLTYTTTKTTNETKEHNLEVPTSWEMFSKAGNKRITTLASRFLEEAEKAKEKSYVEFCKVVFKFLKAYRSMDKHKLYSEASDTDVRDEVSGFLDKVCEACGQDSDPLWDQKDGYPQQGNVK